MKKVVLVIMVLVLTGFLSACGLVRYSCSDQGAEIKENQLSTIKPGMTKDDVLIAFGEPTKVKTVEDNKVWFYCWQRGGNFSVLWDTFGNNKSTAYCATVIFSKTGKVLRVGKGRAGNAQISPVFTVRQERVDKKSQKNENW